MRQFCLAAYLLKGGPDRTTLFLFIFKPAKVISVQPNYLLVHNNLHMFILQ
jgi:hypothetical protein